MAYDSRERSDATAQHQPAPSDDINGASMLYNLLQNNRTKFPLERTAKDTASALVGRQDAFPNANWIKHNINSLRVSSSRVSRKRFF